MTTEMARPTSAASTTEAEAARKQKLGVTADGTTDGQRVPAFVELVRRQLRRDYREEDLTSEGLRIFTTLDPWVQEQAVAALQKRLQRIETARRIDKDSLQGALVVVSAQNGEVQALVGGRDAGFAGFNRAHESFGERPVDRALQVFSFRNPHCHDSTLAIGVTIDNPAAHAHPAPHGLPEAR